MRILIVDDYDFLATKSDGINAYRGEYMSNYSWAEFTASRLVRAQQEALGNL